MERRIDAYLVCGGKYHDFDYARLELLKLLAEDDHIRVQVAQHFGDVEAITSADFLVTYTCDVRPSTEQQQAIRDWVKRGGRWLALHGTNCTLDPPTGADGRLYTAPRVFPVWADTLGSQFVSHPPIEPYVVSRSPGAANDPLVAGIESFEANDELYLMEHHGDLDPVARDALVGHHPGLRRGRLARRLSAARAVPATARRRGGRVLHARPLPQPLGHDRPTAQRRSLADSRPGFMDRARVRGHPPPRDVVGEGGGGPSGPCSQLDRVGLAQLPLVDLAHRVAADGRRRCRPSAGTCSRPAARGTRRSARRHAAGRPRSVGTTSAFTSSPMSAFGTPITATSATCGCSMSTCSASAGIDVDAARDDHVGEAVGDVHEPVVGDVADLAEREHARAEVGLGRLLRVAGVDDAPARSRPRSTAGPRSRPAPPCRRRRRRSARNGGTARPTEPGCSSHSALEIVHVVPTSVAP